MGKNSGHEDAFPDDGLKDLNDEEIDVFIKFVQAAAMMKKGLEPGENRDFICPACGGTAHAGRSGYNGHLHAGCGCCGLSLME